MKDVFNMIIGKIDITYYHYPLGDSYLLAASFIAKILLFSFLVAMFVLRYFHVWQNIEATRRMDIIRLKNSQHFDPLYGCITMTYFPINIILLPFVVIVLVLKSERVNNSILQMQYFLLVIAYLFVAVALTVVLVPLLYFKIVANSVFVWYSSRQPLRKKLMQFVQISISLVATPFIMILTLLVDIFTLNSALFLETKYIEYKYQPNRFLTPD